MSQPIALVDLDDTLFQTVGKCPGGTGEGLRLMSRLVDGSPSGYATQTQQNLLSWLRMGKVIPVTARSRDVLAVHGTPIPLCVMSRQSLQARSGSSARGKVSEG